MFQVPRILLDDRRQVAGCKAEMTQNHGFFKEKMRLPAWNACKTAILPPQTAPERCFTGILAPSREVLQLEAAAFSLSWQLLAR
jgi:hypothetical protein